MRVPDDLLSDLAAHKIQGRGRSNKKNKFNAAVAAAAQASSRVSSPDSMRHQRPGGEFPTHVSRVSSNLTCIIQSTWPDVQTWSVSLLSLVPV